MSSINYVVVRPIVCHQCSKEKRTPYELIVTDTKPSCKECGSNQDEQQRYCFCSLSCVKKFAGKLGTHMCERNLIALGAVLGKNSKASEVQVKCEICNKVSWIKIRSARQWKVKNFKQVLKGWLE